MQLESIKVRYAECGDSKQLAGLFMRVWHISLKSLISVGFLDRFQQETQQKKYEERTNDPQWLFLVAECGNKIVGMVGAKDNDSKPLSYQKQIKSMYVDPDFQGKGIGTILLKTIFEELNKRGVKSVLLWCIAANQRACLFYEKHGGRKIDNVKPPEEYTAMQHVIYAWKLIH